MRSMTGYANGTFPIRGYGNCSIEIKSLNGKNLGISVKLPPELSHLEIDIRKQTAHHIKKGNIFICVKTDYSPAYVKKSVKEMTERIKSLGIKEGNMNEIILSRFIDLLMPQPAVSDSACRSLLRAIGKLTKNLVLMRQKEGAEISRQMNIYIKSIESEMNIIRKNNGKSVKKKEKKLRDMIRDNDQLIKENILIYADKMDISEELQRMSSHVRKMKNAHRGNAMNFILQEMLRETNTIGSKSEDINITDAVIVIKENIEKLKEQALNVE